MGGWVSVQAQIIERAANVRFGSLADIAIARCPLYPKSGLMQCSNHATSAILREIFVTKLPTIFGV
jgi:hypothetical protein